MEGFARRRHVAWPQVERIRVDRRERLGLRSQLLEIDAGTSLHLFSTHELGTGLPEQLTLVPLELTVWKEPEFFSVLIRAGMS